MDVTDFLKKPVPEVIEEPKLNRELSDDDLEGLLVRYYIHQSQKDSDQYVLDYMKQIYDLDLVISYNRLHTKRFGFLCQIVMNDSILPDEESVAFDKMSYDVRTNYKTTSRKVKHVHKETILDKAHEFISLFEDDLEQFVEDGFEKCYFKSLDFKSIKGIHAKYVIESLEKSKND